ncbi:EmrB/QacA subfamily drug resistance transporter [Haloactinopolyspora alba]|uniref:EmrB/QacA subfamily drug resistance transporter n=1 Tax=Haloactinopolyspora alba TaxID=648780 RepID=A0A2P8DV85_9ACTN|nr:MDR family MFS transporter [Haloactinopolyspora alba]PSL01130.1 EmrB/QacA subfamily drug resistance transporter [Haloactinopolyspora alba]
MTTDVANDEPAASNGAMTHRQVLEALSGLLLAMFVAMLSGTIVANALPRIIADLGGTQSQYTWVVTATLLAATATTPIWGKLSDRMNKKLLVQLSISIFVLGSVLAGFSQSTGMLIGFRVLQGLGMGGLQALVQIVLGSMVSPRDRGRYMGYFGAVLAVATVSGPLLGGVIVDTPFLGWRWCFWVGAPIAGVALVLLQKTLHLPVLTSNNPIDWRGALLIPGGISVLLVWVTLAGGSFAWVSPASAAFVAAGVALVCAAVVVERRVPDPVVPPRLMRQRTMILAIVASVSVGIAMFGSAIFFGQYFQIARGYSPTAAGLLTLPMMVGLMSATTVTGQLVTRTGRWKRFLVGGTAMVVTGLALLGTIDHTTPLWQVGIFMAIMGIGVGSTMQNLVLAVQNGLDYRDLGSGTSTVTFFRTLGGASGVSVLGAILASHVTSLISEGLAGHPGASAATQSGGSTSLDVGSMPPAVRTVVEHAYGDGTALVFRISAVVALVSFVAVLFMRETSLRTTVGTDEQDQAPERT